jgi:hypothetical protein
MLGKGLKLNKTLIKLDISHNALKVSMTKFVTESLLENDTLVILDLGNNFLDDSFAEDLALLLKRNAILNTIDISNNPIGPKGALSILNSLLQYNETLSSLGNLDENLYMGVRVREEIQ